MPVWGHRLSLHKMWYFVYQELFALILIFKYCIKILDILITDFFLHLAPKLCAQVECLAYLTYPQPWVEPYKISTNVLESAPRPMVVKPGCTRESIRGICSQLALVLKNSPANAGNRRDMGLIPELGRSPEAGHGNQL